MHNKKRHKDRGGWLGSALVPVLIQALAHPGLATAQTSEVTVTSSRETDVQPIMQIDPEDVQSYGTSSVQDLLDALGPRIQSSMSDSPPVVLINGRLAGATELKNLPPEAIARVDVLPEKAALRYGFPDDRRVVNLILHEHFRAYVVEGSDSQSTEGGGQTATGDASTTRIDHDTQATVRADYKESEQLLESQRDINSPDSDARTLEPTLHDTKLAATFARELFGLRPSFEASVDSQATDSLQGLATTGSGEEQLRQRNTTTTAHIAGRLNGMAGELNWTAAAAYDQTNTSTGGAAGVDAAGGLAFLDAHSRLDNVAVDSSVGGPFLQLPAGRPFVSADFNAHLEDFDTETELTDTSTAGTHLSRTTAQLRLFTYLPLTSRSAGVLPALGNLGARLNFSVQEVSNFGALTAGGFGMNWNPVKPVSLNAAFNTTRTAPTEQNLLAPTVITPDVQTFDFVTAQTAYVTTITGGNPDLRSAETQGTTLGLYIAPFEDRYTFRATYLRRRILDGIGSLPPASEAVELAFPDRFVRDSVGNLIEIDTRPVNLARAEKDSVNYGFTLIPFNGPPSPKAPPAPRLVITLFDTWYLRDTLLVRQGVPELDMLNGAPTSATTGSVATTQSRHALDLRANYMYRGLGVEVKTAWHSATEVDGGTAGTASTLYFSALTTTNLRLFTFLSDLPLTTQHPWAKGLRIDLGVTNVLNAHQKVHDATGATPVGFEPGYVDPLGRVVTLSVRKVF